MGKARDAPKGWLGMMGTGPQGGRWDTSPRGMLDVAPLGTGTHGGQWDTGPHRMLGHLFPTGMLDVAPMGNWCPFCNAGPMGVGPCRDAEPMKSWCW